MRVLVVEDERDTAEALSWGLTAEGYVVDVAGNGVDGLWKATENAYDVIVLDVMLPGLDGYQVATRLREAGRWTPILMLTAMDDDLDHAEGLDSGADDYLPKPFSYPVLLAHLRSLTRRTLGARPVVLAAAGQRAQVGEQDRVGERLGQVVIRPAVQALGVVQVVIHRGEHQDRRPPARLAQPRGYLVAVQAGQHHVQDDDVVGVLGRLPQPVDAVASHVHDVALGRQPPRQGLGGVPLVLDHQHAHAL